VAPKVKTAAMVERMAAKATRTLLRALLEASAERFRIGFTP